MIDQPPESRFACLLKPFFNSIVLIRTLDGGWLAQLLAIASTTVLMTTRVNPFVVVLAGMGIFISLHAVGLV